MVKKGIRGMNVLVLYGIVWNCPRTAYLSLLFLFTTNEAKLPYYHQKVNIRVASQVAKQLKTQDLRKLETFKKISEMLGIDDQFPAIQTKAKFCCFLVKNCKKSAVKHSIEKPILLKFVNLSPSFCPRLYYLLHYLLFGSLLVTCYFICLLLPCLLLHLLDGETWKLYFQS